MNNNSKEELKADLYMLSCIRKIEKVFSCRLMDVTAGKEMNLIDFFLCLAKKNYLSESVLPLLLEPGGIDHSESSRNNQSELIRNSQCTCLAN